MTRRVAVHLSEEVYELIRRRAYDARRNVAVETRMILEAALTKPAAAARPAGRDAKRHEAEGARAAKAVVELTPADVTASVDADSTFVSPAKSDWLGRCRVCSNPNLPYGIDICLGCSRAAGKW